MKINKNIINEKVETIGIIGAMKEEIEPILNYFKNYKTIKYANNTYFIIEKSKNQKIIICQSKIGKVFAAMTTTILIEKFKSNKIIFTGVAGGITEEIKVNDIILADKICQHDFDITGFGHPFGYIPESKIFIETDLELNKIIKRIARKNNIQLKNGIIATGDQFIKGIEKKYWINEIFNADAVEMEGGAIAQICHNYNIPFSIIRSISDSLNGNEKSFNEFMEEAAKKSAKIIIELLKEI